MSLYQLYAFVTAAGWDRSLSSRWPDAPLINNYRLLVFTNQDLPKLKAEYSAVEFKKLTAEQVINAMNANDVGPFICSLEKTKQIINHFAPTQDSNNV